MMFEIINGSSVVQIISTFIFLISDLVLNSFVWSMEDAFSYIPVAVEGERRSVILKYLASSRCVQ